MSDSLTPPRAPKDRTEEIIATMRKAMAELEKQMEQAIRDGVPTRIFVEYNHTARSVRVVR